MGEGSNAQLKDCFAFRLWNVSTALRRVVRAGGSLDDLMWIVFRQAFHDRCHCLLSAVLMEVDGHLLQGNGFQRDTVSALPVRNHPKVWHEVYFGEACIGLLFYTP